MKIVLGIAVALGLTLTAAPVATAAPVITPAPEAGARAAASCTVQSSAVNLARTTYVTSHEKLKKLKTKKAKLKKLLAKAKKAKQSKKTTKAKRKAAKKVTHYAKRLKGTNKQIRKARSAKAAAARSVSSTRTAYQACQNGTSTLPGSIAEGQNPLDFLGETLDALGIGLLVDLLGLEAVLRLIPGLEDLLRTLGLGPVLD